MLDKCLSLVELDAHAKKRIISAFISVFDDSLRLAALLAYLQEQEGLFVAMGGSLVATLAHFFDQRNEFAASFDCVFAAIMSYVDEYIGDHCSKENFKLFLRRSTYSQDYIRPR